MYQDFGKIMKELRENKEMSQAELSCGICSKEYVSKIENGHKLPSERILKLLFERLGENVQIYFPTLEFSDNLNFIADKEQIDTLLYHHHITECFDYIHALKKKNLYTCDEPLQYLLGKEAFLLAKYKQDYTKAFDLSIQSIQLTKPNFNVKHYQDFHFYTIEELWGLYNISYIASQSKISPEINPVNILAKMINFLDEGFFHYDMISQLYPLSCSYIAILLEHEGKKDLSDFYIEKGLMFFEKHYSMTLNFLYTLQHHK